MSRYSLVFLLVAGSISFCGCNKDTASTDSGKAPAPEASAGSDSPKPTTTQAQSLTESSTGQTSPAAAHVKAGEPKLAVDAFLTALQKEQGEVAFSLITGKAREAMHEFGLSPQPVSSANATYTIGRTEFVNPEQDGAYVSTIWSEPLGDEQVDQYEIVWVLRKEVTGWRIAGMASEVLPSEPPLFLDFENPAEMQRKLAEAERTIAAANQGSIVNDPSSQDPTVRQAQNVEPVLEPETLR